VTIFPTQDLTAFRAACAQRTRLLGIDLGTKTIGLALSDAQRTIASPLTTLSRTRLAADLAALHGLAADHHIGGIVVGLPLNMDGTTGPRAQSTRAFATNLARRLALPIALWDERFSTAAVERAMLGADMTRAKRAKRVDALAATYILQGALDRLGRLP
jgi:putative Holliday junction resolvase